MSHAGLESTESSEVAWLGGIISGERSNVTSVMSGSLSGVESEMTFSGATEFSM